MNTALTDNPSKTSFPRRPGSAGLKFFLLLLAVGAAAAGGWVAVSSRAGAAGHEDKTLSIEKGLTPAAKAETAQAPDPRAAAVLEIKQKAARDLGALGVTDVASDGDAFCVYVDGRFTAMKKDQQEQLLGLLAAKWKQSTSAATVPVRVLSAETRAQLFELSF